MKSGISRVGLGILFALGCTALSACTRAGAGGQDSQPSAGTSDQVYGYLVSMSFHGGSGGLVLDDAQTYSFDVDWGVQRRSVSANELASLADAMADAEFFQLPARLHNDAVADGNEVELMGVIGSRSHWSVNYMDPSKDYARALAALTKLAPKPNDAAHAERPEVLYSGVEAYLARNPGSAKAVAVRRWLESARTLLKTNAAFSVRPAASAE